MLIRLFFFILFFTSTSRAQLIPFAFLNVRPQIASEVPSSATMTCNSYECVGSYTGSDQTLTVPSGYTTVAIKLWGAGGGGSVGQYGGAGGFMSCALPVSAANYKIIVGNGGGAGGTGAGGGGGGRSAIQSSSNVELATAGGGGGAGSNSTGGAGSGSSPAGDGLTSQYSGGGGGFYGGGGGCGNSYNSCTASSPCGTGGGGGSGYAGGCTLYTTTAKGSVNISGGAFDVANTSSFGDGGNVAGSGAPGKVIISWAAKIISAMPVAGPSTGGYSINLFGNGMNFITGVTVGGNNCSSLNIISTTQATCIVPSDTDGAVNIVLNSGSVTSTLTNGFTYNTTTPNKLIYTFTGTSNYLILPAGVTSPGIKLWGAGGAGGSGGANTATGGGAGYSAGHLAITSLQSLEILVGGKGYNSGYGSTINAKAGAGGGRSAVLLSSVEHMTAGGGGGGGGTSGTTAGANGSGGPGGGGVASDGIYDTSTSYLGGGGATTSAGGLASTSASSCGYPTDGTARQGGVGGLYKGHQAGGGAASGGFGGGGEAGGGANASDITRFGSGGGGGGGFYGGAGGCGNGSGACSSTFFCGAGGGGGSSYLSASVSTGSLLSAVTTNGSTTSPGNSGDSDRVSGVGVGGAVGVVGGHGEIVVSW